MVQFGLSEPPHQQEKSCAIELLFHQWLKKRRKALDLTHEVFSQRVGCSPNTLRKLESGERRPSRQLAERLADELQITPAERDTFLAFARTQLTNVALSMELPSLLQESPAPTAGPATPTPLIHIPRPLTRIIGRDADLEAVRHYLLDASAPVVTLLGPGGVGKTRLSLEVAADVQQHFGDGVVFVPLATVREAALVLPAIARTLGVKDASNRALDRALQHALRDRQFLLVLDNFEQVMGAASDLANLIALCPQLRILVTSRRPLGIRGEQQVLVRPLSLPNPHRTPNLAELHDVAAVTLFVERVRCIVPNFTLTTANAAAVAGICIRLDGLPLAIELVAARCKLLSPQTLLAQLTQSVAGTALDLLTHGPTDLPDRQQTLRKAIAWSYELLDQPAQQLFARLGCFAGSWTLEAASVVTQDATRKNTMIEARGHPPVPVSFLDLVSVLLDNNLVHEVVTDGPEPRFAILETIREYALEQLTRRGELAELRCRHAAYYRSLAEAGSPDVRRAGQAAYFDLLERERPNLSAALECLIVHDPPAGLQLAGDLWWFWYLRSYWVEGRNWLRRALEHAPSLTPTSTLANAFTGAGALAWVLADFEEAHFWCEQSLSVGRSLGDRRGVAYALMFLGMTVLRQGNYPGARSLLQESIVHFREIGDLWGLAHALNMLRQALVAVGDLEAARVHQQESVDLWRALDDTWGLALALNGLAEIARSQGDVTQAIPLYEESLSLFRGASDKGNTTILLHNLAHAVLGYGALGQAKHLFTQALQLAYELGSIKGVVECLAGLGAVAAVQGEWQRASCLLGYVHERFTVAGIVLCPVDHAVYTQAVTMLYLHMSPQDRVAAWDKGRGMSLKQVVAYATEASAASSTCTDYSSHSPQ